MTSWDVNVGLTGSRQELELVERAHVTRLSMGSRGGICQDIGES